MPIKVNVMPFGKYCLRRCLISDFTDFTVATLVVCSYVTHFLVLLSYHRLSLHCSHHDLLVRYGLECRAYSVFSWSLILIFLFCLSSSIYPTNLSSLCQCIITSIRRPINVLDVYKYGASIHTHTW